MNESRNNASFAQWLLEYYGLADNDKVSAKDLWHLEIEYLAERS